ncbi:MAG TPA: CBS domain-containing protein [Tepidisphaeraceae bacterium]|jgi:CBS domain-containing protein
MADLTSKPKLYSSQGPIVADAMNRDLDFCLPQASIQVVARKMADKNLSAIPVVDNTDRMIPVGVVTECDIVKRVVATGQNAAILRADQCMSISVRTIRDTASLSDAKMQMDREFLRHIPVIDDTSRLVGILCRTAIDQFQASDQTAELIRELSEPVA